MQFNQHEFAVIHTYTHTRRRCVHTDAHTQSAKQQNPKPFTSDHICSSLAYGDKLLLLCVARTRALSISHRIACLSSHHHRHQYKHRTDRHASSSPPQQHHQFIHTEIWPRARSEKEVRATHTNTQTRRTLSRWVFYIHTHTHRHTGGPMCCGCDQPRYRTGVPNERTRAIAHTHPANDREHNICSYARERVPVWSSRCCSAL